MSTQSNEEPSNDTLAMRLEFYAIDDRYRSHWPTLELAASRLRAIPPAAQQEEMRPSPETMEWLRWIAAKSPGPMTEAVESMLPGFKASLENEVLHAREILSFLTSNAQPSSGETGKREPEVTAGGESVETSWRKAAMRIGEDLSDVGPAGYYAMSADQWLAWAIGVMEAKHDAAEREPVPTALEVDLIGFVRRILQFAVTPETAAILQVDLNAILGQHSDPPATATQPQPVRPTVKGREWWIVPDSEEGDTAFSYRPYPGDFPKKTEIVHVREVVAPQSPCGPTNKE